MDEHTLIGSDGATDTAMKRKYSLGDRWRAWRGNSMPKQYRDESEESLKHRNDNGLKITDDSGLRVLGKSSRLFCAYLTLNARGWKRLKIQHYIDLDLVADMTDQTATQGFEAAWLADEDSICGEMSRKWVNSGKKSDTSTPKKVDNNNIPSSLALWSMAVSPDNKYVAAGSNVGAIFIWRLSNGPHPILGKYTNIPFIRMGIR